MKYQFFLTLFLIFLYYSFFHHYLRGYSFPSVSNTKLEPEIMNTFRYLYFHPRTHGSYALNSTYESLNKIIKHIYNRSTNRYLFQLIPYNYIQSMIGAYNSFNLYTIHIDINSTIFYFHKISDSITEFNFPSSVGTNKKIRRKKEFQNKKILKEIFYHNSTKPLIIACRVDSNPLSPSIYDSSIHISAILEAIYQILNSKEIAARIKHDFAFVFTGCEEFDQLGAKKSMNDIFKDGGYYLFLSGFGVGRPLTLFSQSSKSSSVLKALTKVKHLPMISFISNIEEMISLIKAKSFSMAKIKESGNLNHMNKEKIKPNSKVPNFISPNEENDNMHLPIFSAKTDTLSFLNHQGNINQINNYKYRYRYFNDATQFRNNQNFSGAELSFIGSPLLHSTSSDIDNYEHNFRNIKLVMDCILQFLTNFKSNSEKDDIGLEEPEISFGISPLVFLIKKKMLISLSNLLILLFCFYLIFYLTFQVTNNYLYSKSIEKQTISKDKQEANNSNGVSSNETGKRIENITVFKITYLIMKNEFSFILHYFCTLLLTLFFYLIFVFLISVINPSSMMTRPVLYPFLIIITIFTIFISLFQYFICHTKSKSHLNNCCLENDWHFLQVVYMTILLIAFKKFDFQILIVLTAIFFIFFQFCPIHKKLVVIPILFAFLILSPCIFTYALLYAPFSLYCQDLPIFFADIVPCSFIFIFFIHMSVFTLPLYFTRENRELSDDQKYNENHTRMYYLCAISQIYFIFLNIKYFLDHMSDIRSKDKKENTKVVDEKSVSVKIVDDKPSAKTVDSLYSLKFKIEYYFSARLFYAISFLILIYFVFKSPPFSYSFPIKGTFSHYFDKKTNLSEISFIPKNGRRTVSFIWKILSKASSEIRYVYNYNGRLLSDPGPAFVKTFKNFSLPFFFTHWPVVSISSIQHENADNKYSTTRIKDENNKKEKLRTKMVRKIIINLFDVGPNVDFIYFVFDCGSNTKYTQCVDRRIRLIDPSDSSTISMMSKEEKLFLPYLSNSCETVFRIGSFVGSMKRKVPQFEINVTKNSPIKLTVAYQSFIETKELKDFKSKFNRFAINEINENEVTQSVFTQTQMI